MKKRNILIAIAFITTCAAVYGFIEYNRVAKDLIYVKAKFTVSAEAIMESFAKDELKANKQYLGRVVAVSGNIRAIEATDKNNSILVLGDETSLSSVRCSLDSTHMNVLQNLHTGEKVTVKGIITGYNADETGLLGSDIQMNRCIINSKK
ncbi:MAG TPA: hypothetical protein VH396_09870 [Chitinophagaceae bacterium]